MAVGSSCCEMFGSVQKRTKLFFRVGKYLFGFLNWKDALSRNTAFLKNEEGEN
jgi:hypothetical protein